MPVPGVVQILLQVMLNIIFVDILMTDKWLPQLFLRPDSVEDDDKGINEFFDINGFSSKYMIINLGSCFIYLVLYLALIAAYLLILLLSKMCTK